MKKLYLSMFLGIAAMLPQQVLAAQEDRTEGDTSDFHWTYWNDVHDDGSYWPNWTLAFPADGAGPDGLGTDCTISYVLKKDGSTVKSGNATISYRDAVVVNAYTSLDKPEGGEYTLETTVLFSTDGQNEHPYQLTPAVTFTAPDRAADPVAELSYTVTDGAEKSVLSYEITVKNLPDGLTATAYRVWLDAPGNVPMGESTTQSGSIDVDVTDGNHTYWLKGLVTLSDNSTMNTTPNDIGVDFKQDLSGVEIPVFTLTAGNPQVTGETTGTLDYAITVSDGDADDIDFFTIYVVTNAFGNGDVEVARVASTTDLDGTLTLTGLKEKAVNELWVKYTATLKTGGVVTPEGIYPGEAQGWTGLSINTALEPGIVYPELTVKASNPVALTATTGTVDYELTVSDATSVKSYNVWVVTTGDVELGRIDATTDLTGTISLSGLNESAVTELWIKAEAVLTNDAVTTTAQYPGEPEGWTGLSIDTSSIEPGGITEIGAESEAPARYFDLMGCEVSVPTAGIYVRVQGSSASKVLVK